MTWRAVSGVVVEGYRVASGVAGDSPYPRGSIAMQLPAFRRRGLDLTGFFLATINISIRPLRAVLRHPRCTFPSVPWSPDHAPETFSLSPCRVVRKHRLYAGWIYLPHPETKRRHHQDPATLEVVTSHLPGIAYGAAIDLLLLADEVALEPPVPG